MSVIDLVFSCCCGEEDSALELDVGLLLLLLAADVVNVGSVVVVEVSVAVELLVVVDVSVKVVDENVVFDDVDVSVLLVVVVDDVTEVVVEEEVVVLVVVVGLGTHLSCSDELAWNADCAPVEAIELPSICAAATDAPVLRMVRNPVTRFSAAMTAVHT